MRLNVLIIVSLFLFVGCATVHGGKAVVERESVKTPTVTKKQKSPTRSRTVAKKSRNKGPDTDLPKTYKKRQSACQSMESMVKKTAAKYDLEPELVMGVIKVESSFNPKTRSRVGAAGLMQVMARTGERMKCDSDLYDPESNVDCGCRVLRRYLDLYDGNPVYALSAYNAGPGNANPSSKGRYLPFNFAYVEKVFRWRNIFVRFGCH